MGKLIELKSVGCLLNMEKGIVYPQYENGKPDMSMPISLIEDEVSSEWYRELSLEDGLHVTKGLANAQGMIGAIRNDYLVYLKKQNG